MATYTELQQQIAELQEQAEKIRKEERDAVIAEVRQKIAEFGITFDELKQTAKKQVVAAKYRDPASGKTWSGRGIKPKWLSEGIAAGKSLADFAI